MPEEQWSHNREALGEAVIECNKHPPRPGRGVVCYLVNGFVIADWAEVAFDVQQVALKHLGGLVGKEMPDVIQSPIRNDMVAEADEVPAHQDRKESWWHGAECLPDNILC